MHPTVIIPKNRQFIFCDNHYIADYKIRALSNKGQIIDILLGHIILIKLIYHSGMS